MAKHDSFLKPGLCATATPADCFKPVGADLVLIYHRIFSGVSAMRSGYGGLWWTFAIYHGVAYVLCAWQGWLDIWGISVLLTAFGTALFVSRRERRTLDRFADWLERKNQPPQGDEEADADLVLTAMPSPAPRLHMPDWSETFHHRN
jgi:hypothetical protein